MNAQDLLQLTERLAALVEHEVAVLKGGRPASLNANEDERARLLAMYAKACNAVKRDGVANVPQATKLQLKTVTERLHAALKEEGRLLSRFRHVSEGIVKAIAQEVEARRSPLTYAKAGTFAKPVARPPAALAFNQSV